MWREVRPRERDWIFLGSGAVLLVLLVLLVKLLTGWEFVNLVCLLAGGAIAFFVERLIRWREKSSSGWRAVKGAAGPESRFVYHLGTVFGVLADLVDNNRQAG